MEFLSYMQEQFYSNVTQGLCLQTRFKELKEFFWYFNKCFNKLGLLRCFWVLQISALVIFPVCLSIS